MTLPSVASVCSSCWGMLLFVSGSPASPCCGHGNEHPFTGLAFLALGRQQLSINILSCYCHCDDYSSGGEPQCQLTIIESLHTLAELGSPLHLLDAMTLSPPWAYLWHHSTRFLSATFHALWSSEHYVPFVFGSDKVDNYTHSLRSHVGKVKQWPWPPANYSKEMTINFMILVFSLIFWLIMTTDKSCCNVHSMSDVFELIFCIFPFIYLFQQIY